MHITEKTKPILFLDFDGTISVRDAIDLILERFADERWREIEERWKAGEIGSRQCLAEQVALVNAAPEEINRLLDEIKLDEGFIELARFCRWHKIEIYIVSDGFDYCIRQILSGVKAWRKIQIFSSSLKFENGAWKTHFPHSSEFCRHNCATCKPQVMKKLNPHGAPAIFVGDGLSDRFAASAADLVFAKKSLAAFCAAENIPFAPYRNLRDVAARLEELLGEKDFQARPAMSFLSPVAAAQEVLN